MMEKQKGILGSFFQIGTPQCGLATGILGVVLAFMFLFLGLLKTLFVAVFFAGGFALGAYQNKMEWLKKSINRLFPPKGE